MSSNSKTKSELEDVMAFLERDKVTAVVRSGNTETARQAAEAVIRAGFTSIEFTLSIPGCLELITEFCSRPGLLVGGGTVLSVEQAEAVVRAGGRYVVCPCLELSVVKWCAARNICCMAGVYTPSEMWAAHKAGAHIVKLFPGAANGAAFVKAVRGPMPFLKIVPTTGVTEENCQEYMGAGVFGVSFTAVLFDPEDMQHKRFDRIEERARRMVAKTRGAPQPKL